MNGSVSISSLGFDQSAWCYLGPRVDEPYGWASAQARLINDPGSPSEVQLHPTGLDE